MLKIYYHYILYIIDETFNQTYNTYSTRHDIAPDKSINTFKYLLSRICDTERRQKGEK